MTGSSEADWAVPLHFDNDFEPVARVAHVCQIEGGMALSLSVYEDILLSRMHLKYLVAVYRSSSSLLCTESTLHKSKCDGYEPPRLEVAGFQITAGNKLQDALIRKPW